MRWAMTAFFTIGSRPSPALASRWASSSRGACGAPRICAGVRRPPFRPPAGPASRFEELADAVGHVRQVGDVHGSVLGGGQAEAFREGVGHAVVTAHEAGQRRVRSLARSRSPARWGADTAASTPTPAMAAFCAISKLARLVMQTKPSAGLMRSTHHGTDEFVERVVAAHVFAHQLHRCRRGLRRMASTGLGALRSRSARAVHGLRRRPGTTGSSRRTWPRLSVPHRPHPVRPASAAAFCQSPCAGRRDLQLCLDALSNVAQLDTIKAPPRRPADLRSGRSRAENRPDRRG